MDRGHPCELWKVKWLWQWRGWEGEFSENRLKRHWTVERIHVSGSDSEALDVTLSQICLIPSLPLFFCMRVSSHIPGNIPSLLVCWLNKRSTLLIHQNCHLHSLPFSSFPPTHIFLSHLILGIHQSPPHLLALVFFQFTNMVYSSHMLLRKRRQKKPRVLASKTQYHPISIYFLPLPLLTLFLWVTLFRHWLVD